MRKRKWTVIDMEIYKLIKNEYEEKEIIRKLEITRHVLEWTLGKLLDEKLLGGKDGKYIGLKDFPWDISLGDMVLPQEEEKELMEKLIEKNQSNEDMAEIFQVSSRTIGRRRKKYGFKKKSDRRERKKRINVYLQIKIYKLTLSYQIQVEEVEPVE